MLCSTRNGINKVLYIFIVISFIIYSCGNRPLQPEHATADSWRTSSPEQQGLDSAILQGAWEAAGDLGYVNSLLVFRNGYLVREWYFNGYDRHDPHLVQSVSKSFLSALVGVAFSEGYLDSLDQPVIEFFPEIDTPDLDERKRSITIGHLLTMRAGFQSDHAVFFDVYDSDDWVRQTWDLPLFFPPGQGFMYNTFEPHLLSVIITRTTGVSSYEYAQSALFEPLGVRCHGWEQDPQNYFFGGSGMWFTPRDMARLGYLYLRGGSLRDQIVPPDWVEQSLVDYQGANHWEWGELKELGYGFLWWLGQIDGYEVFTALGHGGQFILCVPELEMIVVTICFSDVDWEAADRQERSILSVVAQHILPSVIEGEISSLSGKEGMGELAK